MSIADDVREVFEKMPEAFLPQRAAGINAIIQLNLSGEGGGHWTIEIAQGEISVDEGSIGSPALSLNMAASDYVALTRGQANPMNLFTAGRIKLQGDINLALKFQDMFDKNRS